MEALNEKIEEEMTEVKKEITEINEKWKQTSNELQQAKENINTRVNYIEEANQIQITAIRQETEDEMNRLKSKTEERCMGIETTVNTVRTRVNDNYERIEDMQRGEIPRIREEIETIGNTLVKKM